MDAPIGLFAPDGTTALLEFPHQAGMGCRAALHANQVPQSLVNNNELLEVISYFCAFAS